MPLQYPHYHLNAEALRLSNKIWLSLEAQGWLVEETIKLLVREAIPEKRRQMQKKKKKSYS